MDYEGWRSVPASFLIPKSVQTVSSLPTKDQFEANALFHGTPKPVTRPSVHNSRLKAVFCTPVRSVAEQYAGPTGTVIAVRPKADSRIVDATGTYENENWHWISGDEWHTILSKIEQRGIELRCNYDIIRSNPLTWEAFFDPDDGPAATAPSGVIEEILGELGYAGVSTHDAFGFLGDIYKRHGAEAYGIAQDVQEQLGKNARIPVVVFFKDDAFMTYDEFLRE